jgi:hypothetical protein
MISSLIKRKTINKVERTSEERKFQVVYFIYPNLWEGDLAPENWTSYNVRR